MIHPLLQLLWVQLRSLKRLVPPQHVGQQRRWQPHLSSGRKHSPHIHRYSGQLGCQSIQGLLPPLRHGGHRQPGRRLELVQTATKGRKQLIENMPMLNGMQSGGRCSGSLPCKLHEASITYQASRTIHAALWCQ
jgi:hypothetical protein